MSNKEFMAEIEKLDIAGLYAKAHELADELFKLRVRHKSNQLETSHRLGEVRKNYARVLTMITQKSIDEEEEQAAA